jgi:hypothetical protein
MNFKDRLISAFPVFSQMLRRKTPIVRTAIVAGGAAGALTCSGVKVGDELFTVVNLTDGTDVLSEFSISADGEIDNTGGTATTGDTVLVQWIAWAE